MTLDPNVLAGKPIIRGALVGRVRNRANGRRME